jgi:hypothetical protein
MLGESTAKQMCYCACYSNSMIQILSNSPSTASLSCFKRRRSENELLGCWRTLTSACGKEESPGTTTVEVSYAGKACLAWMSARVDDSSGPRRR